MTTYTDVFGGANIYPSEISYSYIALSADIVLSWPEETSTNVNLATKIIDVSAASANRTITLPNARKTGTGQTILFNNVGANAFVVKDAAGVQVVSIAPATLWQIYLTNNSTEAGNWESLQYGASISIANASALAGTGIVAVGTLLSQSVPITEFSANYSAGITDRAKMYNWTGAGGTLTLPQPAAVGNDWFMYLRNSGTGAIVADAPGLTSIDGSSSLSFQPGESAIIASDGLNFYTIGFGKSSVFAFDYTVIDVSGSGDYTLTGTELNRVAYRFTGVLTGNRAVVVPATVQQYWVDNETTGAYSLVVKPQGGGADVAVGQGSRAILYCDGTDVVNASTAGISLPLTVSQGGTGATTAGSALINLGGGAVGISVFESSTQAAAWSALGVAQAGNVDGGAY
jgi:hypothetical protein